MFYGNNAKLKGLDVILDDLASFTLIDPNEWLDIFTVNNDLFLY